MEQLLAQYPWLVLLAVFVLGMFVMWLLEMFILRRAIKGHVTEVESSLKQRDSELQTAQNTLAQTNTALKSKGDELQTALTARAATEKQLADTKAQFTQASSDLAVRNTEVNDLRTKLTASVGERDQLRTGLAGAQTELEEARAQHQNTLAEVAKLGAAAAATAAVVSGLEKTKGEQTAQIEALNGDLENARVEQAKLQGVLDETNLAKANLQNELTSTLTQVGKLETQVGDLDNVRMSLESDVARLTAGALAASELIKQIEGDKAELAAQHTQLQSDHEGLQKAKALDDAELAELKLNLNKVNAELGITTRDKETYQQTLSQRVEELGRAQTELAAAKEDNSNLLADVAKFTARAAATAAAVQGLEKHKQDMNAEVERLRSQLDASAANAPAAEAPAALAPETIQKQAPAEDHQPQATLESAPAAPADSNQAEPTQAPIEDDGMAPFEAVCPQDLSSVRGVGAEFEQRLYNAGIGTYWDLSQRSEEELARIFELGEGQREAVNLAAIRGDALRLARETRSQKRTWKGGVPDDFDLITGIGRTYEGRLYEAGICTYAALANTSVEQLAAICRAPQLNQNHYQSWIDQARALNKARHRGL